jgi:hypothetical protein
MFGMGMWAGAGAMEMAERVRHNERGDVPGWVMITFVSGS